MTDIPADGVNQAVHATLRVGADGRVCGLSVGARALLGARIGAPCAEVVRAVDPTSGVHVCVAGCAMSLARGEGVCACEHLGVTVRGRPSRLRCERVGDEVVVTLGSWESQTATVELLTEREREVLAWVAAGLTDRGVAERLGVAISTIRTHVEHARAKLGAATRAQAIARAIATGQVEPHDG